MNLYPNLQTHNKIQVQLHSCTYDKVACKILSINRNMGDKMKYVGYERTLQRTVFIDKIRMLQQTQALQRTRRNTIGRRSTRVRLTCQAFPLWSERQSTFLLSFVRFSYQFSSVICLFAPLAVLNKLILYYFYTIFSILYYIIPVQMVVLDGNCAVGCGPGTDYP
jgi:hypothetical protein